MVSLVSFINSECECVKFWEGKTGREARATLLSGSMRGTMMLFIRDLNSDTQLSTICTDGWRAF
jgi:hypothetical protein